MVHFLATFLWIICTSIHMNAEECQHWVDYLEITTIYHSRSHFVDISCALVSPQCISAALTSKSIYCCSPKCSYCHFYLQLKLRHLHKTMNRQLLRWHTYTYAYIVTHARTLPYKKKEKKKQENEHKGNLSPFHNLERK